MKKCGQCNVNKDESEFYKYASGRCMSACKDCKKAYASRYRKDKPDVNRQAVRKWSAENPEHHRECMKQWYEKNRDYALAKKKEYRDQNPEKCREYNKRAKVKRRYAVRYCDAGITLNAVFKRDGQICGICGTACAREDASMDHITPLSKGGTHTWDNIQLAHITCNCSKGNRHAG